LNSEVELLHDEEILRTVVRRSGLISEGIMVLESFRGYRGSTVGAGGAPDR